MGKLDQVTNIQSDSGSIFYGCSFDTRGGDINISDASDRSQLEINGIRPKQEQTRREILRWLSDVQYKERHKHTVTECLEGTGEWIFKRPEFSEWLNAEGSSALWLHGIPGCGKTFLISTIIERLRSDRAVKFDAPPVAYFYCSRKSTETQFSDPAEVLSSLIKQIICTMPKDQQIQSAVAQEYNERKEEDDMEACGIARLNEAEATRLIIKLSKEATAILIIDALDECDPDRLDPFISLLNCITRETESIKLIITSREEGGIIPKLNRSHQISITSMEISPDIQKFVSTEIQNAIDQGRLLNGKVSFPLQNYITGNLIARANGMFLWASLQIRSLCNNRALKLPDDLMRQLQSFPELLNDMYSHIITCIDQIQGKGHELATAVIRWLLCTKDPTIRTTMAFLEAAGLPQNDTGFVKTILDVCCNLVVYDCASTSLDFVHFSAREFLETRKDFSRSISESFVFEVLFVSGFGPMISIARPLDRYRICYWLFHYDRSGEHRKELFDYRVKSFMFDGSKTSKRYIKWANYFRGHFLDREGSAKAANDLSDGIVETGFPHGDITNPIDLASCNGWLDILRYHQKHEASDVFSKNSRNIYASATEHDQSSVIEWLLECDIHPSDDNIMQMFRQQREGIIKTLISYEVLKSDAEIESQPLLVLAVQAKSSSIVELLLQNGATVDCLDRQRRTPLYHAIWYNIESLINLLLHWGADPEIPDNEGITPLKLAVQRKAQVVSKRTLETDDGIELSDKN